MKLFLELIADAGKMKSGVREGEQSLSGLRKVAVGIGRDIEYATSKIGMLGTAATAISSGLVLKKLFSVKDFIPIDDALLLLQSNLKLSEAGLDSFREKLSSLAGQKGMDISQIFGLAAKMSYAFKPDDIVQIISASDMAAKAMKADLGMVNDRILQIMKIYRLAPKEAKGVAEALVASRADLESLDVLLQRLIMKGGSRKDFSDQLAIIGGLKKAGVDSTRVVVAVDSVLSMLDKKQKALERSGLNFFKIDPATGEKVKKDTVEILQDLDALIKKTWSEKDSEKRNKRLDEFFAPGASEVFPFLMGQIDKIKKAKEDQANAAKIAAERAAVADRTWGEQLEKIRGHLAAIKTDYAFVYEKAKKPFEFMADSPKLTKGLGYGAAGLSAAVLAVLAYTKGKDFFKGWGKTGLGVAEGLALQKVTGVTPVFVTGVADGVMGGLGGLGLPGTKKGGGGGNGPLDTAKDMAAGKVAWDVAKKWGGRALPVVAAGGPIVLAGGAAVAGGATGLYSIFDALRGGTGDNWISDWAQGKIFAQGHWVKDKNGREYEFFPWMNQKPEVKNEIKLSINFDQFGMPYIDNTNSNTNIEIERGNFWKLYRQQ